MSWRHPDPATARKTTINPLVLNGRDLPRVERFEEVARAFDVELRILRLDAQKETVAACQREPRHVEDGVIWLRKPVQCQHPEHARQRRAQNRGLEGDGNERPPAV